MGTPEGQLLALAARVSDGASDETSVDSTPDWGAVKAAVGEGQEGTLHALKEIARVADAYRALVRSDDPVLPSAKKTHLGGWGHFELIEKLGEGTAAEVFKAHDTRLDHVVALKLFKRTQLTEVEKHAVLEEGRRHARVKHANIATIHDADEHNGRIGISMEHIDGSTLHDVVAQQGPHGSGEAANIGVELCRAMAAIHGQGLVHGDIKAQNVMREKGGRIVLMDFSTSQPLEGSPATGRAHIEGTPIYMAPELFEGAAHSPESDIYALGVLLFYLATGDYPVKARSLGELRSAIRRDERRLLDDLRPDLPAGLSHVIHKAIARDPAARFRSAGELQHALRRVDMSTNGQHEVDEPTREARARPEDDVSTLVRLVRFAVNAAAGIAFLAFLGYANEFNYNVVLHVPERFTDYSPLLAVVRGLRSLSGLVVLGTIEIVPIALVFAVLSVVVGRRDGRTRRPDQIAADWVRRCDFDRVATGYAVLAVLAVTAAFFAYRPLFSLFVELAEADANTRVDVSLLSEGSKNYKLNFDLTFTQLTLLLIAGWVCVFKLWKPARITSITASMRSLSAFVIFLSVVLLTGPWRLLYKSGETRAIEINNGTRGCIAAESGDEVYVWSKGPTQPFVIRRGDPRIRKIGEVPANIFDCEG